MSILRLSFPQLLAITNLFSVLRDCLFWTLSINETIQYVAFYVWFLSLSVTVFRFIHVIARVSTLFLWRKGRLLEEQVGDGKWVRIWFGHIKLESCLLEFQ